MNLTSQQVDKLRANLSQLESTIRLQKVAEQLTMEGNSDPNRMPPGLIPPVWNWVYPEVLSS